MRKKIGLPSNDDSSSSSYINVNIQLFDKLMIQNNLNAINCYFELLLLRDGSEIGKLMGIAPINSSSQIMENAPGS